MIFFPVSLPSLLGHASRGDANARQDESAAAKTRPDGPTARQTARHHQRDRWSFYFLQDQRPVLYGLRDMTRPPPPLFSLSLTPTCRGGMGTATRRGSAGPCGSPRPDRAARLCLARARREGDVPRPAPERCFSRRAWTPGARPERVAGGRMTLRSPCGRSTARRTHDSRHHDKGPPGVRRRKRLKLH